MSYVKRKYLEGQRMETQLTSILLSEMKGAMFISGYRGKGKTTLAIQADFPWNIAFFDFEDKGEGYHNQLEFGYYKAISQAENNPLARGKVFIEAINKLQSDRFTVVILDNIRPLEDGLTALITDSPKHYAPLYGKDINSVIKDSYGAKRGIANELISDAVLKPLYAKGVKLIIGTSHLTPVYGVPNKMKMQGKDRWQELSILTLILVDGDNFPVPSAIVQKEQLASITAKRRKYSDEEIKAIMNGEAESHHITRRLPYRLPEATFQKIRWYLNNPANLGKPAKGESLIEAEVEPFIEQMSKEQIAIQLLNLEAQKRENQELLGLASAAKQLANNKLRQAVQTLDGQTVVNIFNQIKAQIKSGKLEYDGELAMKDIVGLL